MAARCVLSGLPGCDEALHNKVMEIRMTEQSVTYQTENEKDMLIKQLSHRRRMAIWGIAFGICGFVLCAALRWESTSVLMFTFGLASILYVLRVNRKLRAAQAPQALSMENSISPRVFPDTNLAAPQAPQARHETNSIIPIVVSRGILVTPFILLHDLITIWPLGIMSGIALIMAVSGKPAAARARFAKAVVYGTAAIAISSNISKSQNETDLLVSKLEEYKRQHGVYPERLDAMVPTLLPAIPKVGSMSFQYNRKEDTSSYRLSYRPSIAGPCSYTPERGKWKCQAR